MKLVKIGLRNIKTALAVFICLVVFDLLGRTDPFYACIAAIICMKETVENSFIVGKQRIMGTLIGGSVALILTEIWDPNIFLIGIGVSVVIYLCTLFSQTESVIIAGIVFVAVMTNMEDVPSYIITCRRMIDTFIGIGVAILVNKIYFKASWEKLKERNNADG